MRAAKLLPIFLALAAAASVAQAALSGGAGDAAARGGPAGKLHLSGSVEGLYPGASAALPVRVSNRGPRAVVVRKVRARVGNASAACRASLLRVSPSRRRVRIRPRAAGRIHLRATLAPEAGDACQNASFPLRFRARAVVRP